jgi:hypothetical protein
MSEDGRYDTNLSVRPRVPSPAMGDNEMDYTRLGDTGLALADDEAQPFFRQAIEQGKGRLARPWGEQSARSSVDHLVQAFDSPLDEPVVNAVQKLAHARGVTMAQVALAWVLHNPAVCAPIVGATRSHHLPEAIAALELKLTGDEIAVLESPTATTGLPGTNRPSDPARPSTLRERVQW